MRANCDGARVLFVDDDEALLQGVQRNLFDHFEVEIATGGPEALEIIGTDDPFEVIVSDMQMPGMDGAAFLARARKLTPDSTRILLTGQANMTSAIEAINDGRIFRYLCKPCNADALVEAVRDGVRQHRRLTEGRQALDETIVGVLQMVIDLQPNLQRPHRRPALRRRLVRYMVGRQGLPGAWRFDVAAMLCELGLSTLPRSLIVAEAAGRELTEFEQRCLVQHPASAARMLASIPRLRPSAQMIEGLASPAELHPSGYVQWGTEILRAALALETALSRGMALPDAVGFVRSSRSCTEDVLNLMRGFDARLGDDTPTRVEVSDLLPGMVLTAPVLSRSGPECLAWEGHVLTAASIEVIRMFDAVHRAHTPLEVVLRDEGEDG